MSEWGRGRPDIMVSMYTGPMSEKSKKLIGDYKMIFMFSVADQ